VLRAPEVPQVPGEQLAAAHPTAVVVQVVVHKVGIIGVHTRVVAVLVFRAVARVVLVEYVVVVDQRIGRVREELVPAKRSLSGEADVQSHGRAQVRRTDLHQIAELVREPDAPSVKLFPRWTKAADERIRDVAGAVNLAQQVLGVGPDGHVDDNAGAAGRVPLECLDRGRVAVLGLQPPEEARCLLSGRVDRVEGSHETGQDR